MYRKVLCQRKIWVDVENPADTKTGKDYYSGEGYKEQLTELLFDYSNYVIEQLEENNQPCCVMEFFQNDWSIKGWKENTQTNFEQKGKKALS